MTDVLEKDLQNLLLALIAVDSQNPSLVSGADGEGAIADLITGWAARAGLDVERIEPTPGRPSLLIIAHGTAAADAPSLPLCGHLDTVGVADLTFDRPTGPRSPSGATAVGRRWYTSWPGARAAVHLG